MLQLPATHTRQPNGIIQLDALKRILQNKEATLVQELLLLDNCNYLEVHPSPF